MKTCRYGLAPVSLAVLMACLMELGPVAALVAGQEGGSNAFSGVIDGRNRFYMTLKKSGTSLTGSYFFVQTIPFSPKRVQLKGSYDDSGQIVLNEIRYDDHGDEQVVKAFVVKPDGERISGGLPAHMSGQWFKNESSAGLPVSLSVQRNQPGQGRFVSKKYDLQNKRQNYTIHAEYPQIVDSQDAHAIRFNRAVKNAVLKHIRAFKKQCAELARTDFRRPPGEQLGYTEDISCEILAANRSLISLTIEDDTFYGGAHGVETTSSLNYDLTRGRLLELSDVFRPQFPYLKSVSRACIQTLHHAYPELYDSPTFLQELHNNASARSSNYHTWNVTPYGLQITFAEYQVAPYAYGEIQIVLPYNTIQAIIRPHFVPR